MKNDFERLVEIRDKVGLSFPQLAIKVGIKGPQPFYDIKSGKHGISKALAEKICAVFPQFSYDWVLSGSEEMQASALETRPHVPFEVFAGRMGGHAESIMLRDCEQRPLIPSAPPYDLTITVAGQSMAPVFESGDIVAVRRVTDPSVIRWGEVYVVSSDEGVAIKRVYLDGDRLRLASYNPDYPDYSIPASSAIALYKVVALMRIF